MKIGLLHHSTATRDFRALQETKIQCTILVQCGIWLGPDCRIILPGMMVGSSITVERNCWTMLPATRGWFCHAVFRSKMRPPLGAIRSRPVRLSLCIGRSKAKARVRPQQTYTRNTSSWPYIARKRRSCAPFSDEGYGSKTIGMTWCRRPSPDWQHHDRLPPGATPEPISTGSCGISSLIVCGPGPEAGLWIPWSA